MVKKLKGCNTFKLTSQHDPENVMVGLGRKNVDAGWGVGVNLYDIPGEVADLRGIKGIGQWHGVYIEAQTAQCVAAALEGWALGRKE